MPSLLQKSISICKRARGYDLALFYVTFHNFFEGTKCRPFDSPYRITIRRSEGDINEVHPDLVVICDLNEHLGKDVYYHGVPSLVVEILSEGTRRNDLLKKLNLYMHAGVKEYWTVDPKNKHVSVYTFKERDIKDNLVFRAPGKAESRLFPGLIVDLEKVFMET